MCTLIISIKLEDPWPIIIAANRDEMAGRPSAAPGRHWPDRPEVLGGKDLLAGGSWMAVNTHGVVAAMLNREGTLGPAVGKRSRGELVLDALDHADASEAAAAFRDLDGTAYRAFNMLIADNSGAWWIRAAGGRRVDVRAIPSGIHMLTAREVDDAACPRIAANLPRFRVAVLPRPDANEWSLWPGLLADGSGGDAAMEFMRETGFGTVSSSLLALPAADLHPTPPLWLYADGPPSRTPYLTILPA